MYNYTHKVLFHIMSSPLLINYVKSRSRVFESQLLTEINASNHRNMIKYLCSNKIRLIIIIIFLVFAFKCPNLVSLHKIYYIFSK